MRPPRLPTLNTTPMTHVGESSVRTRNTVITANVAALKKLLVAVQPTTFRRIGCPKTKASPSLISSRRRRSGWRASGIGSCVRIATVVIVGHEEAGARRSTTAYPAPNAPTRAPPKLGPATCPNAWLAPSLPFASTSSSGSTSTGR